MSNIKKTAIVRENKNNHQKTITIPKQIKSIKEYDKIEFSEDEKQEVKIRKLK